MKLRIRRSETPHSSGLHDTHMEKINTGTHSLSSLQDTVHQMVRTESISTEGNIIKSISSGPPVEIKTYLGGNLVNHLSTSQSYTNGLRSVPLLKESENKQLIGSEHYFPLLTNDTSVTSLLNQSASFCQVTSSDTLQLYLMTEEPILLYPDNDNYLEKLKEYVYDPEKYLQRCIAIHQTMEKASRENLQSGNKKNNSEEEISSIRDLNNPNFILPYFLSSNYKCLAETKQSTKNNENITQFKKNALESSNITKNVDSETALISKNYSNDVKAIILSISPSMENNSNAILRDVTKVVMTPEAMGLSDNENSILSMIINNHVQNQGSNLSETLTVVESQNNDTNNKIIQNHSDINVVNRRITQEEIMSSQHVKREVESKHQYKRKKSATYNARKGRAQCNTRRGKVQCDARNQRLKLILEKMQLLLQPSSSDLIEASPDNPVSEKPGCMSQFILDILMDTVKQGFLKGISSVSDKNELVKIQKALSAQNLYLMTNMLLEKVISEDPYDNLLKETEKSWYNGVKIDEERNLTRKYYVNNEIPSNVTSSVGKATILENINSNEIVLSGLTDYLASETSSEKHTKDSTLNMKHTKDRTPNMEHTKDRTPNMEHTKDRTPNMEHTRDRTPKMEHTRDRAPNMEHTKDRAPNMEHTKDRTPNMEHTRDRTPKMEHTRDRAPNMEHTKDRASNMAHTKDRKPNMEQDKEEDDKLSDSQRQSYEFLNVTAHPSFKKLYSATQSFKKHINYDNVPVPFDKIPDIPTAVSFHMSHSKISETSYISDNCIKHLPVPMGSRREDNNFLKKSQAEMDLSSLSFINKSSGHGQVDIQHFNKTEREIPTPKLRSKSGHAWKTPQNFFKDYRYSQRNINFRCNGQSGFENPKLCAQPCQRLRAQNLLMESHARSMPLRNAFMSVVHSMDVEQNLYYSSSKPLSSIVCNKSTRGTRKNIPSQTLHMFKVKKMVPAAYMPVLEKKETKMPVNQRAVISSSSSMKNNCKINKKRAISLNCDNKLHSRTDTTRTGSSHHPDCGRQSACSRSRNRLLVLVLPTIRHIEDTIQRYGRVLSNKQLERLHVMLMRRKRYESVSRIIK